MSELQEVPEALLPRSFVCLRHERPEGIERGWVVTDRQRRREYVTLLCGCTLVRDRDGLALA